MKKAWIEGGVIRDISADPSVSFTPSIAAMYSVDVPDGAENGDTFVDGVLTKRPLPPESVPVAPVAPKPPIVGPNHFKLLFTVEEGVTAKGLRATDPVLDYFWSIIDDPRTDIVDLSLSSTQGAIEYTLTKVKAAGVTVDVPARKAQIMTGELQ